MFYAFEVRHSKPIPWFSKHVLLIKNVEQLFYVYWRFVYMHACAMHAQCPQKPESTGSPGPGALERAASCHMGTGILLSHLSSLLVIFIAISTFLHEREAIVYECQAKTYLGARQNEG